MADPNTGDAPRQESSYTPASFEKRAAAWMGVAYMLMLLFILNFTLFTGGRQLPGTFPLFLIPISAAVIVITFAIYTGGRELPGTFPLFLVPVSITLAVVLVRRMKLGICPGGIPGGVLGLILCAAGVGLGLALGLPALLAALGV